MRLGNAIARGVLLALMMFAPLQVVRAEAIFYYYGLYQRLYQDSYLRPVVGGKYERQQNNYVSGVSYAYANPDYGIEAVNNEQWLYEFVEQDVVLSSLAFSWSKGCVYASIDGGAKFLQGCVGDYFGIYLIGNFYSRCMDTRDYIVRTTHTGNAPIEAPFKPTEFIPAPPDIGNLDSITPEIPADKTGTPPKIDAGVATIEITVKDNLNCNKPLEDFQIEVKNTIVPQSGSHKHFMSDTEKGSGKYTSSTPAWSSTAADDTRFFSKTDRNGEVTAEYQAGPYGVLEKIEVTVDEKESSKKHKADAELQIAIGPTLVPLESSGLTYVLAGSFGNNCDQQHNDGQNLRRSHYVTPQLYEMAQRMQDIYDVVVGGTLCFNDATLRYGGLFDAGTADRKAQCHESHRRGIDIDVNTHANFGCPDDLNAKAPRNGVQQFKKRILDSLVTTRLGGRKITESSLHYRF